MIQKGQLIFYDNENMMCFNVEHFLWQDPPIELLDITALTDEVQAFVTSSSCRPTVAYFEESEEIVKLDPTTMKRIARYNFEKENEALLKEINERKKEIADIQQKETVLRDRFKKAISMFKEIMNHGYCDMDDDEDEDEWE
jgi:hypothetical protein